MFLISSCSCLRPIHWSQVLSQEWRCSWSSADRLCSNYIWVINNFINFIFSCSSHSTFYCTSFFTFSFSSHFTFSCTSIVYIFFLHLSFYIFLLLFFMFSCSSHFIFSSTFHFTFSSTSHLIFSSTSYFIFSFTSYFTFPALSHIFLLLCFPLTTWLVSAVSSVLAAARHFTSCVNSLLRARWRIFAASMALLTIWSSALMLGSTRKWSC